jgi:hypothetical protein
MLCLTKLNCVFASWDLECRRCPVDDIGVLVYHVLFGVACAYCRTFKYLKFNRVLLSNMKIITDFIGVLLSRSGVLLSGTGVPSEFYCRVFLIIFKKWVLMSLEFYCRIQRNFYKLFKILGFYCRWSSSVLRVLRSP